MLAGLKAAISGVHVIRGGEAAGLRIVAPRKADPAMRLGTYEPAIQQCISSLLAPGGVFVDIGANIGFFSLLAAHCVGPKGQVYAFEPVAGNAASIVRSSLLNGFSMVEVFAEAVGEGPDRAELMLARHIGGAMLAAAGTPPDVCGSTQVDVVSLDDAIELRALRPPDLVKIDVEGAELEVLHGMARTLHCARPTLIYEVDDESRGRLEARCREIGAFLNAAGYELGRLPASYPNEVWQVEHILARPVRC